MKKLSLLLLSALCVTAPALASEVTHVNPQEAAKIMQENSPAIIDIRTAKEYSSEHIAGAVNIDFNKSSFSDRLSTLDKSRTYLIHCRSGSRSKRSLKTFKKLGFENIIHLDGGINAWKKAGGATVQ